MREDGREVKVKDIVAAKHGVFMTTESGEVCMGIEKAIIPEDEG
jgi:hypothetical protein